MPALVGADVSGGSTGGLGLSVPCIEGWGDLRGVVGSHWETVDPAWVPIEDIGDVQGLELICNGKTRLCIYVDNTSNAAPVHIWVEQIIGNELSWLDGPIPCIPGGYTRIDRTISVSAVRVSVLQTVAQQSAVRVAVKATTGG
uniref:Uncharacterized protein n=1 Tax=viral metagenome TaxID=1070528 RepID=A0A6M3L240_9ZZZZ